MNVAYGSPLLAIFHTPPPSLVAITVGGRMDGWMAGDGRACMCWRLHRLLLIPRLRLRVHGIPITGEGKGWSKLGRSLTLADHARFLSRFLVYSICAFPLSSGLHSDVTLSEDNGIGCYQV